ncbi:MAG: cell wall metabolism sensor histidine kinase WalK [Planctomycetes bacterium]|nr:cell wall metabolism sensor histidine kinase WalK [Planctomycetota bacterium]
MDASSPAPQDTALQEIEALRRAYEVSRFVQERSREIRGARATSDVVKAFAEAARELVGSGGTQFYLRGQSGEGMVLHKTTGDTTIRRLGAAPWRPSSELLGWVTKERRTTTVPGENERDWHTLVPLVVAGEVSGVLVLDVPQAAGELAQQTVEALSFLAEEAAAALIAAEERGRLDDELGRIDRERSFLANILDSITNGILVADLDGRILQINRNAAAMLDIQTLDVVGQPFEPLLTEEVRTELRALFDETVQVGFAMERLVTTHLGGTEFPIAVGSSLLRDDALQAFGCILVFRDMTASREMDRLRKLDQMKSDFVANVSHELRTPLTSIKAYCEALAGMERTPQELEFLQVIEEEGDRLIELIEDLLNVSRIQSGTLRLHQELAHPGDLVKEVLALSKTHSDRHTVTSKVDADVPEMMFDWNRMKEILINLISNAMKYSPAGGEISVALSVSEGNLRIAVEDHGIGISAEDQQNLFQQFYRVDGSLTAQVAGTGLGLAIVKGIAEAHGGAITVRSEPGKGSVFTVVLPIRKEPPPDAAPQKSPFS